MSPLHGSRLARALLVISLVIVSACGGDSATGTDTVASVTMSENAATLLPGETKQLTATARDANGAPLIGRSISWTSSEEGVASVTDAGLVTAHAAGAATITATSEGREGTATITVVPPVAIVEVIPATASLGIDETVQLTATPRDAAGEPLTGRTVSWTSSSTTVATVSSDGLVTARALGQATITAAAEGIEGAASITVTNTPPPPDVSAPVLDSLEIDTDTVTLGGAAGAASVALRVSDALTGVQSVTVNLRSPSQNRTVAVVLYAPSSGTRTDGIWRAELDMPADAELGNWTLDNIILIDVAGNIRVLGTADLANAGFETVVHVRE